MTIPLFVGYDPREQEAYMVACATARACGVQRIRGVVLSELQKAGMYTRPTEMRLGKLYDVISEHHMSTEFANSRFLVKWLWKAGGWIMFTDCDVMFVSNIENVWKQRDDRYAFMCVKHAHIPSTQVKMDGQIQYSYPRKNWTSVFLMNLDHPANQRLTLEMTQSATGRDLHNLFWLRPEEIGELDPGCNWLVGEQKQPPMTKIIHYTLGGPWFEGNEHLPYADEWFRNRDTIIKFGGFAV